MILEKESLAETHVTNPPGFAQYALTKSRLFDLCIVGGRERLGQTEIQENPALASLSVYIFPIILWELSKLPGREASTPGLLHSISCFPCIVAEVAPSP